MLYTSKTVAALAYKKMFVTIHTELSSRGVVLRFLSLDSTAGTAARRREDQTHEQYHVVPVLYNILLHEQTLLSTYSSHKGRKRGGDIDAE